MLNAAQLRRSAALAVLVTSLGAGTAAARPADVPLRPDSGVAVAVGGAQDLRSPDAVDAAATGSGWTQARTEGLGVQPIAPVASAPSTPVAQPLTKAAPDNGGIDWTSIGIGAAAMLGLLALAALAVAHRPDFRHIGRHHHA